MMRFFFFLACFVLSLPVPVISHNAYADDQSIVRSAASNEPVAQNIATQEIRQYSNAEALSISQSVLGQSVGHYNFLDVAGNRVGLKQFLGKPVIISLVYTSCHYICPTTTQNLNRVVKKAKDAMGADSFNVLTIGFDTYRDTPEAMSGFAQAHSSGAKNWYFLASDAATMQALSRDLGFIATPSAAGFDHLIQATILDKQGRVYRQVYGLKPKTPHFVEPIKELVFGEPADDSLLTKLTAKVNLFCTVYDPTQDRYVYSYSIFVGLTVGLIFGVIFLYIFYREWRASSNKKP